MASDGFHSASVDQIADRAGLSIGALYSNFAGKDDLLFAVFEGNARAFQAYTPPSLELASRIVLFRATDGKNEGLDGPELGWNEFLDDRLEVRQVLGNHYTMLASPNARELAEQLRTYLDSVSA